MNLALIVCVAAYPNFTAYPITSDVNSVPCNIKLQFAAYLMIESKVSLNQDPHLVISINFCNNFFASLFQKPLLLLKTLPILIMLLISFSFNHTTIFCINTCVTVLINQYSTGLFVSYYFIQRKSNCMKLNCDCKLCSKLWCDSLATLYRRT